MFCSGCGQSVAEGSAFCPQCGRAVGSVAVAAPAAAPSVSAPPAYIVHPSLVAAPGLAYAGFWLRFVAYIIDSLILGIFVGLILLIGIFATGFSEVIHNLPENPTPDIFFQGAMLIGLLLMFAIVVVGTWLYYACMESSRIQGTVGKMVLGILVTDLEARPVSFARASGRFFAKFITGLIPLCIGYIMAGFTAKKQALHDMIASCLVLRKI
jgi:uncharacterized RDD family membrane protein YckC